MIVLYPLPAGRSSSAEERRLELRRRVSQRILVAGGQNVNDRCSRFPATIVEIVLRLSAARSSVYAGTEGRT